MLFAIHWHESAMDLHMFPIPIPPPASLPIPSLWVFPVHQPRALVSCIPPGLVICFTLDSTLVSMLFSQNIPPSPSPTESKILFCTSVSLYMEFKKMVTITLYAKQKKNNFNTWLFRLLTDFILSPSLSCKLNERRSYYVVFTFFFPMSSTIPEPH